MKTIYGHHPYFKNSDPMEVHDETANKLVEMGRASFEKPEVKPSVSSAKEKVVEPHKEIKVDKSATTRRKK